MEEAMVLAPERTIPRPLRIPLMTVFTTLARNSQREQLHSQPADNCGYRLCSALLLTY